MKTTRFTRKTTKLLKRPLRATGFASARRLFNCPFHSLTVSKNENCSFFAKEVRKLQKVAESDKVCVGAEFAQLSLYSLTGSKRAERPAFRKNSQNFQKGYWARQSLQTRPPLLINAIQNDGNGNFRQKKPKSFTESFAAL